MGFLGFAFEKAVLGGLVNMASPSAEAQQPSFVERAVSHVSKLGM